MENKIVLSPKKILNKQFEITFKGYSADEVDHFLDVVAADYTNFAAMLNELYEEIESLQTQLSKMKEQMETVSKAEQEEKTRVTEANLNSNIDLLRRLSQLEKEVYNKKD